MTFHIITIFPEFVQTVFEYGVLRRAVQAELVRYNVVDLRDFTDDVHRTTDDAPFGGGPGMVMLAEPFFRAVEAVRAKYGENLPVICLTPAGERFDQQLACEMAGMDGCILLCGRYEGIDQRVLDHLVDRELSIGDYVLSGGELAAMAVVDAVARQVPGVVGNEVSLDDESFNDNLLDWPHYTRPEVFRGISVPPVLLSGHHAKILSFRREQSLLLTYQRRPELLSDEQLEAAKQILRNQRPEGAEDASPDS